MRRKERLLITGILLSICFSAPVWAQSRINVRELGAVGDGVADDTAAIQKALNDTSAEVFFPAGTYRITQTLFLGKARPTAKYSFKRHFRGEGVDQSKLVWDGEAGGTLLWTRSMYQCLFSQLTFEGVDENKVTKARKQKKEAPSRAGILILCEFTGGGNMINQYSACRFRYADTGIKMGTKENQATNSDVLFENILAHHLNSFFWTSNNQAVDFTFNFLFVYSIDTVLRFERGGNLLVNSLQATDCGVVLGIEGGGRNCATFTLNNVRTEAMRAGGRHRYQLLKADNLKWEQALVNFIGYDDIQWMWYFNKGEHRTKPLCEIGPGVHVTFQSSSFESPVATLHGKKEKPASLVIRESTFGFINPQEAIAANAFGYFKVRDCFTDKLVRQPDMVKWPTLPILTVPANAEYKGTIPEPMKNPPIAQEEALKRRKAFLEILKQK